MQKALDFIRKYFFHILFLVLMLLYVQTSNMQQSYVRQVTYSEFTEYLKRGEIAEVFISESEMRGLVQGSADNRRLYLETNLVDPQRADELAKYGVKFSQETNNTLLREVISWLLPIVFFLGFWFFITQRAARGLSSGYMSVGKSKAKIFMEADTKVTFDDVAGADEAKTELRELVDFLREPEKYRAFGSRMPKGVLLVGPPGCGKTLIAKAIAGEAKVPFFVTNGAEFVEMFVGVGAARVRDLFEQAKKKAPCIIFIDELDALGKARISGGFGQGNDEKEQTLNQLLVELDGFDSLSGIILLAATNRPEILDPALLRAGRFDRQVLIDKPDKIGRQAILKQHSKKYKLADDLDLERIAALTPGFSGADLENLINEASLIAIRRQAKTISEEDMVQAMERVVAGLEKRNRLINPQERRVVAFHEMGHAMVGRVLCPEDPVHKVSIIPRGIGSLGYTIQRPTEDRYLMTLLELKNKMAVFMGGRAAENIVFSVRSTGASDDIAKASDIAKSIVMRYGMSEKLGDVAYEKSQNSFLDSSGYVARERFYSEDTATVIDHEVRKLLAEALQSAESIIRRNLTLLEKAAEQLLVKETLLESDLEELFAALV